jgi:predicted molibdopterin-dependent oxidoreductase YjgC
VTSGQFQRVAETGRKSVTIIVDGAPLTAFAGDTVMTALLVNGRRLRVSEFGDGPRSGFCVMGACQDCWVGLADGGSVRACTTFVRDGLSLLTAWPAEA